MKKKIIITQAIIEQSSFPEKLCWARIAMMEAGIGEKESSNIYLNQIGITSENPLPSTCGNGSLEDDLAILDYYSDPDVKKHPDVIIPTLPIVFEVEVEEANEVSIELDKEGVFEPTHLLIEDIRLNDGRVAYKKGTLGIASIYHNSMYFEVEEGFVFPLAEKQFQKI